MTSAKQQSKTKEANAEDTFKNLRGNPLFSVVKSLALPLVFPTEMQKGNPFATQLGSFRFLQPAKLAKLGSFLEELCFHLLGHDQAISRRAGGARKGS